MSKRTLQELRAAVSTATNTSDIAVLNQCATELEEIGTAEARALGERALGVAYHISGNYSGALELYHRALALYGELGDRTGIAQVISNIGNVYEQTGNYPQALEHYHRALALYEEQGNQLGIARVTGNIGNVYEQTGNYPQALEYYHRALALHEELGDQLGIATVTSNIGIVYTRTGNYPQAQEHYHRALTINEELGNQQGIASVTGNLGNLYRRTDNYPQALEHYHRALALYEELGNRFGVAKGTGNLGILYADTGDSPQALEYYYRALAIHKELGDRSGIARVTGNIIEALIATASYAEAEALLASMDAIQIDDPGAMIMRETARALIQEHLGKLDDATHTLSSALETARKHSLMREQAAIHKHIRDLCQERNDFAGYIEHNNEFTRIQEEINGKETAIKLTVQEKQREIDAREKEHQKFMAVLHSTLPKHIANRVARGEQVTDHIDDATVMFVDIVGFTTLSSMLINQEVITLLDAVFGICDEACKKNNVTRIKTIGDSYLAAAFPSTVAGSDSGAHTAHEGDSHIARDGQAHTSIEDDSLAATVLNRAAQSSFNMAHAALEIVERIKAELNDYHPGGGGIRVRIGLHVGPVTAGVLGKERLQYDIWGDTVNVASRMEGSSEPNRIHVSENFAQAFEEAQAEKHRGNGLALNCHVAFRGETVLKGKGLVNTFWLSAD